MGVHGRFGRRFLPGECSWVVCLANWRCADHGFWLCHLQWFFWGYSLAFSDGANKYIGDLSEFWHLGCGTASLLPFFRGITQSTSASRVFSTLPRSAALASPRSCSASTSACSPPSRAYIFLLKAIMGVLDHQCSLTFCWAFLKLKTLSPVIAVGAIAERARLGPVLIFTFLWSTLVYDPIACWTWNANGWSFIMGGLDFAGGTP